MCRSESAQKQSEARSRHAKTSAFSRSQFSRYIRKLSGEQKSRTRTLTTAYEHRIFEDISFKNKTNYIRNPNFSARNVWMWRKIQITIKKYNAMSNDSVMIYVVRVIASWSSNQMLFRMRPKFWPNNFDIRNECFISCVSLYYKRFHYFIEKIFLLFYLTTYTNKKWKMVFKCHFHGNFRINVHLSLS